MMTNKIDLHVSLNSSDPVALLRSLSQLKPFNQKPPSKITTVTADGFEEFEGSADWIEKWIPICTHYVKAHWGYAYENEHSEGSLRFDIRGPVKFKITDFPRSISAVLDLLESLPWTIAGFDGIYLDWLDRSKRYYPPGFADMHFSHGFACAFKGFGHNRLVSRRWLEYGPWRVLKGANDTTLIQFHDLEADWATALEQAKVGHKRMGISDIGGFLQAKYVYSHDVKGFYEPEDRRLRIVVIDRVISQREMLDYCAARHYQVLGKDKPLDKVAFVFMREEEARAHLHELWLRELECWTFIDGVETRIDTDYHPTPEKPDWVRRKKDSKVA